MAIKKGDFVRVNIIGKVKGTDEVVETSYEEIAREAGIYDNKRQYKPIPIVVGGNHLLPLIEEGIIGLDVGDKKTVVVDYENGFGPRDPSLIQLIPMKEFKKENIKPYPGLVVNWKNSVGKVLTVNSGRVRVDFNNELAGKDLEFDIEIVESIEDEREKIISMIELHYTNPNVDLDKTEINIVDDVLYIKLDDNARLDQQSYYNISLIRIRIASDIWNNIEGINKVHFVEEFTKKVVPDSQKSEDNEENNEEIDE